MRRIFRSFIFVLLVLLFGFYTVETFALSAFCVYTSTTGHLLGGSDYGYFGSTPAFDLASCKSYNPYCVPSSSPYNCPANPAPVVPVCPGLGNYTANSVGKLGTNTCLSNGCTGKALAYVPQGGGSYAWLVTYSVTSASSCVPPSSAGIVSALLPTTKLLPGASNGVGGVPPANASQCGVGTGYASINNMSGCLPSGSTVTGSTSTTSGAAYQSSSSVSNTYDSLTNSWTQISTNSNGVGGYSTTKSSSGGVVAPSGAGVGTSGTGKKSASLGTTSFDNSPIVTSRATSMNNPHVGSFSVTSFLPVRNNTCPLNDASVIVMKTAVTVPFSELCSYLAWIAPIVIALAWLLAFRIILSYGVLICWVFCSSLL